MRSSWLCSLLGLLALAVGCTSGSGGASSGRTGGAGSGGVAASGGRSGSGGTTSAPGSGGATATPGSGGGTGSGGSTMGQGGSTATGGVATGGSVSAGGAGTGGAATGGRATGGSANGGTGGVTTGGAGGQGGKSTTSAGGAGTGGVATGGSAGGQGGVATGGTTSSGGRGGSSTGGTTSSTSTGGSATGGRSGTGGQTSAYRPCPTDGSACKIMPFGDSITDGFNADTPGGYRVELFRLAHSAGKNITFVGSGWNGPDTVDGVAFPHNHEGHSGWTIDPAGGRSGISTLLKNDSSNQSVMVKYTPHIVLLMIGTNDAIDNYDMANAPTRLGNLVDTIFTQLPDVLLVVAEPIPARGDASKGDDTGLSARIKTFDDAIPAVVKARADKGKHILVVDMYTPFNPQKTTLLEDQWHPNLQGYVLLGTQWYQVLQSLL